MRTYHVWHPHGAYLGSLRAAGNSAALKLAKERYHSAPMIQAERAYLRQHGVSDQRLGQHLRTANLLRFGG